MTKYAESTEVPADRSRVEIERTLTRYGATEFGYAWQADRAVVMFSMAGVRVRFILAMPDRQDKRFTQTGTGRVRSADAAAKAWEQGCRQSWRALALVIKAKLEAVDSGIVTLVEEFAAHIVLPGGLSVGDVLVPSIVRSYELDSPSPMLAAFGVPAITDGLERS